MFKSRFLKNGMSMFLAIILLLSFSMGASAGAMEFSAEKEYDSQSLEDLIGRSRDVIEETRKDYNSRTEEGRKKLAQADRLEEKLEGLEVLKEAYRALEELEALEEISREDYEAAEEKIGAVDDIYAGRKSELAERLVGLKELIKDLEEPGETEDPDKEPTEEPGETEDPDKEPTEEPGETEDPDKEPTEEPGETEDPDKEPEEEPGETEEPEEKPEEEVKEPTKAEKKAIKAVEKLEKKGYGSFNGNLKNAEKLVEELEAGDLREELEGRIAEYKKAVEEEARKAAEEEAEAAVVKLEEKGNGFLDLNLKNAEKLVKKLEAGELKEELEGRIAEYKKALEEEAGQAAEKAVARAEKTKLRVDISKAEKLVKGLEAGEKKQGLEKRLEAIKPVSIVDSVVDGIDKLTKPVTSLKDRIDSLEKDYKKLEEEFEEIKNVTKAKLVKQSELDRNTYWIKNEKGNYVKLTSKTEVGRYKAYIYEFGNEQITSTKNAEKELAKYDQLGKLLEEAEDIRLAKDELVKALKEMGQGTDTETQKESIADLAKDLAKVNVKINKEISRLNKKNKTTHDLEKFEEMIEGAKTALETAKSNEKKIEDSARVELFVYAFEKVENEDGKPVIGKTLKNSLKSSRLILDYSAYQAERVRDMAVFVKSAKDTVLKPSEKGLAAAN